MKDCARAKNLVDNYKKKTKEVQRTKRKKYNLQEYNLVENYEKPRTLRSIRDNTEPNNLPQLPLDLSKMYIISLMQNPPNNHEEAKQDLEGEKSKTSSTMLTISSPD